MPAHNHDVEVKKVDRISPTQVRLTIAFSGQTVAEHENRIAHQYTRKVTLPGFRPGKAPVKMVLERYRDKIRRDVVSHLLEAGLLEALGKTGLMPVSRPRFEMGGFGFEENHALEFKAEFEVEPDVQIKSYKGVPIKKVDLLVAETEVESTLQTLRERLAVLEPSPEVKPSVGSFAVVEVGYTLMDDPAKTEKPSSFTVELGAGRLITEIDSALQEMTVGEVRKVVGTFPGDYQEKDLAGKTATFECKILELKKRILPTLDDAFAETVRPGTGLQELREDIQKNLANAKQNEARRSYRKQIVDYLVKKNPFEVPRTMVEMQSRRLLDSMAQDLKSRGENPPTLKDEEMKAVWGSAEEIVRGGMVLKRIAVQEKIELAEEKLNEGVAQLAKQWSQTAEEARGHLDSQGALDRVRDEVLTDQIFDFLIQNAKTE